MVADTSFSVAREASVGVETVHDYEAAEKMAYAGLAQLESLHVLSPENADGLYLLVRAWTGVGQGFILDEYERALERDDERAAQYQLLRARAAFERAKQYGLMLVALRAEGFAGAAKTNATLRAWLEANYADAELAPELLWLGAAWLGRIQADSTSSGAIAELWVGVELIRHSVRLDETTEFGLGHVVLGAYHARAAIGELDESKRHFDRALEINGGRYLATQLQLAQRYHCQKHDKASYDRAMAEVLDAVDPLPSARLANAVAKRFARRYSENKRWQAECGFGL
jgi:tetratricopeptide (TPR) repeat protein